MQDEQSLKRAACLIASQLPDDAADALKVLAYATGVVRHLQTAGPGEVIPLSTVARTSPATWREDAPAGRIGSRGIANPG